MDTLVNRIHELSKAVPDKTAVVFREEALTYKELYLRIRSVAHNLHELGVSIGDRVCFSAVSKPEMIIIYLGIQYIGGVAVFLDKNSTAENMRTIFLQAEATVLVTNKKMDEFAEGINVVRFGKLFEAIPSEKFHMERISENMLAEILFTTGTTGRPKGVMLDYKAVHNIYINTIEGTHINENTVMLLPLPLNHSFALRVLRAVLYSGATVVLQNGFTFARELENNIIKYRCNSLACVPASYEVVKTQMQDRFAEILSKLNTIEFGAGSLTIRQRLEITQLLPNVQIYNTWGSSETGGAIFCDVSSVVKNPQKIGSLGRPLPGKVEINIVDSDGNVLDKSVSHTGRMILKGDMVMRGYWKDEENTSKTLIDGWIYTGDIAYMDSDGDIFMLGRADDIINVGGEKVSPIEVEETAGQYSGIKECACIGADDPDGITGQIPVLFVVSKRDYAEKDLIKFISSRLEKYKIPQRIIKVADLPRNRMQKVDRRELRKLWEDSDSIELMNPTIESILSRRSVRKFTNEEISMQELNIILKCGYYAPSGHNMQTWKFTVLRKSEDIENIKQAAGQAAKRMGVAFYGWENPKVLILISNDIRNADGCQDSSCAAENIMISAKSLGISSVWLNSLRTLRNEEPVKGILDGYGIPENHIVWASIALGRSEAEGVALKKNKEVVNFV